MLVLTENLSIRFLLTWDQIRLSLVRPTFRFSRGAHDRRKRRRLQAAVRPLKSRCDRA